MKTTILRVVDESGAGMYRPHDENEISLWRLATQGEQDEDRHPVINNDKGFIDNMIPYINKNAEKFYDPYPLKRLIERNLEYGGMMAEFRSADFFLSELVEGNKNLRFGYLNEEQYKQWVYEPEWRENLSRHGGTVQIFEIDEHKVMTGDSQVVFFPSDATLVDEVDPTYFD